jgi:trans-2,3-dihydro-3-hydroxyanthranilate isomerase
MKRLNAARMQDIAREMHFSETAFINPVAQSDGAFDVRIFTPVHEVPFAGHPVLGLAFVIRQKILKEPAEELVLNLAAEKIAVSFEGECGAGGILWMRQKSPLFTREFEAGAVARVLSLKKGAIDQRYPVQEVSTGLPFIIVPLVSREVYDALIRTTTAKAVLVFCRVPYLAKNTLNARMFPDYFGVPEDPATGCACGCLAGYLFRNRYFDEVPPVIQVERGCEINRPSLLYCRAAQTGDRIDVDVGGNVILVARGELLEP